MQPMLFEPYLRPQIWGGRRLQTVLGKSLPPEGTFGEAWEISAHPHHVTKVVRGDFPGLGLAELWDTHRGEIWGTAEDSPQRFPWLVKYLDCDQLLSVQVHPNDHVARRLLGDEMGKTECWVVLAAEPSAEIYAGLQEDVTPEVLREHLNQGTVAECLHRFTPQPGDSVFIRAGTVHAAGGGLLLAEIQQTSDATFRLFDWNRTGPDGNPRQLHIDEALASIDWDRGPVRPQSPEPLAGLPDGVTGERLAACEYFCIDRFAPAGDFPVSDNQTMQVWMVLQGEVSLQAPPEFAARLTRGSSVLIPAACREFVWCREDSETHPVLLRCAPYSAP